MWVENESKTNKKEGEMILFLAGVVMTLVVEAIVYGIYKSERKDGLIAEKLGVEFEEGIILKDKKR